MPKLLMYTVFVHKSEVEVDASVVHSDYVWEA